MSGFLPKILIILSDILTLDRMLRDLEHLGARFTKIESAGDFVKNLLDLVQKRQVKQAMSAAPPSASSSSAPTPAPKAESTTAPTSSNGKPGVPGSPENGVVQSEVAATEARQSDQPSETHNATDSDAIDFPATEPAVIADKEEIENKDTA